MCSGGGGAEGNKCSRPAHIRIDDSGAWLIADLHETISGYQWLPKQSSEAMIYERSTHQRMTSIGDPSRVLSVGRRVSA
jgi:hypothetical protein